jgi:hypothetical protein
VLHPFCRVNNRDITDLSIRPGWCPLKPLPEKMTGIAIINRLNGIKTGWNNCIDAITGGNADD